MLNLLFHSVFSRARRRARAPRGATATQLLNASVDDLALCLRCLSYVGASFGLAAFSSAPVGIKSDSADTRRVCPTNTPTRFAKPRNAVRRFARHSRRP